MSPPFANYWLCIEQVIKKRRLYKLKCLQSLEEVGEIPESLVDDTTIMPLFSRDRIWTYCKVVGYCWYDPRFHRLIESRKNIQNSFLVLIITRAICHHLLAGAICSRNVFFFIPDQSCKQTTGDKDEISYLKVPSMHRDVGGIGC